MEAQLAAMRKKASDALPGSSWSPLEITPNLPPERADIVIVGGGVMGWSIAYWLKQKERVRGGVKVVVVEKDPKVRPQYGKLFMHFAESNPIVSVYTFIRGQTGIIG